MISAPLTITQLKEGMNIYPEHRLYFYVANATVKTGKNGGKYLDIQLFDGVSTVNGKVWDLSDDINEQITTGAVILVTDGKVRSYQGNMQITINAAEAVDSEEIDNCCPGILPESPLSAEELTERWEALKNSLADRRCISLINAFEKDTSVWKRFILIPAGRSMHHAYRRGLFEHTVTLAENVAGITEQYRNIYDVDHDLAVTAAMLHDVGKGEEFIVPPGMASVDRYSDPGKLLGHIYLGAKYVGELCATVLPQEHTLRLELEHIILSHHGSYEFGSPKLPMTMEAMIVAMADNLDAHLNAVNGALISELDDRWTRKVFALGRNFYYSDYMKKQQEGGSHDKH